jgi:hypothetical protein
MITIDGRFSGGIHGVFLVVLRRSVTVVLEEEATLWESGFDRVIESIRSDVAGTGPALGSATLRRDSRR